jgi:hypothetical protein
VPVNNAGFFALVKAMIALFATKDDKHDLPNQLRDSQKPRDVAVQTMWYRINEINDMVDYLPGQDAKLMASQLLKAFHDAMPQHWRDRFLNAGLTVDTTILPNILHYFPMQERNADQHTHTNETGGRNGIGTRKNTKWTKKSNSVVKNHKPNGAEKGKKTPQMAASPTMQSAQSTPKEITPGASECYANSYNKNANKCSAEKGKEKIPKRSRLMTIDQQFTQSTSTPMMSPPRYQGGKRWQEQHPECR